MLGALLLAVLPVVAPQRPVAPLSRTEVDEAVDKGVAYLMRVYDPTHEATLALDPERFGRGAPNHDGVRALMLYTLLECGVEREAPVVRRLVCELSQIEPRRTYDLACLILALSAYDPVGERAWIESSVETLVSWQGEDGTWAYPERERDLSNTQYATLALWAAARAGVDVDASVWRRCAETVLSEHQHSGGGFSYHPPPRPVTGSMTVAGVATLALCEMHLRLAGEFSEQDEIRFSASRAGGIEWMSRHFTVEENPKSGAYLYYYLYGIERMGALCGLSHVGDHDWYGEGARELLDRQGADGAWADLYDPAQTCFALLFLRRATSDRPRVPRTGPSVGRDAQADATIRVEGDSPITVSLDDFKAGTQRALEWPDERGLGLRVERVEILVDDELRLVKLHDWTRPIGNERFEAKLTIEEAGKHRVRARFHLRTAPADRNSISGSQVLESDQVEVEVRNVVPVWLRERDRAREEFRIDGARVKATSEWKGDARLPRLRFPGENAIDGNERTPWLADLDKKEPTLKLTLKDRIEADRVYLKPGSLSGFEADWLARPVSVEIKLNGRQKFTAAMAPDPDQRVRVDFGELVAVKRLDVKILSSVEGGSFPAVGLCEITLGAGDP